jgi:hypothetical protein
LSNIEAGMTRGDYIDPTAGKVTFAQYVTAWIASQTTDPSTREPVEMRLRLHAVPHLGTRPMASFQPTHIRLWIPTTKAAPLHNVRHVFTTTPGQPWWSLPIRPGERAYQFDPTTGAPAPGSGRPYPHPVLPPVIAAIEAERCGPYRDAFGLCTGCGLRGRIQHRCAADDPDAPASCTPVRPAPRRALRAWSTWPWGWSL